MSASTAMVVKALAQRPAGSNEAAEPGGTWWGVLAGERLLAAVHANPCAGLVRPRFSFHIGRVVHAAPELGLYQVQTTLQLGHDATGEAELSGLSAFEGATPEAMDLLLEAALASLVEAAPKAWVLVELPGWRDAQGRSPFWDFFVCRFLPEGLGQDDGRFGPAYTSHLGALLPRQPIHAAFLPEVTQQALGALHAPWQAWGQALDRAGFCDWRHCRIDDGGPIWARAPGLRGALP
jgi:arginine/ornithine N-succinyltransferase beta subunit